MNDGAAGLVLLPSYTCASWSILPSSLMVGWPLGVFWKLVVLSSIGSITQCCIFMSMDVSRTSDCVSGDMISRHKMRITWVGKRARHRGLFHDYHLGIGVRSLESMPSYGDWAALFHWTPDVDQWIILLLSRSLHSPFYARILILTYLFHPVVYSFRCIIDFDLFSIFDDVTQKNQ